MPGFAAGGFAVAGAVGECGAAVRGGRLGQADDVAGVIAFRGSGDARYMCGALVEVNGGKPVL